MTQRVVNISILIVILVGFGLRVYHLGRDSFWNDEAGQALAAIQPTIDGTLKIAQGHAMAMPMDYLVSRIVSKVGTVETVMRFPSLIWGTMTLALCFVFFKRISRPEVAVIATWLLALSASHIYYSQEMRFYAALSFFWLLSNLLLFRALIHSSMLAWVQFVLVTALGSYFHPYVLLAICSGFLYFFARQSRIRINDKNLLALIASSILLAVLFLPGYLYFGENQSLGYPLFLWGGSLIKTTASGLGWRAIKYAETSAQFGIWELLNIGFTGMGAIVLYKERAQRRISLSIAVGVGVQVVLIILADWVKGYPYVSRQILHLMPIVQLVAAIGIISSVESIASRFALPYTRNLVLFGLMIGISLSAIPRLFDYYDFSRGNGKQVVSELTQLYQPHELIFVIPGYEEKIYRWYSLKAGDMNEIDQALRPTSWEQLERDMSENSMTSYLITPSIISDAHLDTLASLGFTPLLQPKVNANLSRILFTRKERN